MNAMNRHESARVAPERSGSMIMGRYRRGRKTPPVAGGRPNQRGLRSSDEKPRPGCRAVGGARWLEGRRPATGRGPGCRSGRRI